MNWSSQSVIAAWAPTQERQSLRSRAAGRLDLDAVQERVDGGSTALYPAREAVATRAPIVGRSIDCLRRATFDHLSLDAGAFQRTVLERRGDRGRGFGDGRRFGGVLEFGHGVRLLGSMAGGGLRLSVLSLDRIYRLSRSARATASPAVRTPSLSCRRANTAVRRRLGLRLLRPREWMSPLARVRVEEKRARLTPGGGPTAWRRRPWRRHRNPLGADGVIAARAKEHPLPAGPGRWC